MRLPDFIDKGVAAAAAAVGGVVLLGVILQGVLAAGGWTFIPADFSLSGQFGDSFGPLSALMASLAAIGAWSAVLLQRREISSFEDQREADSKERSRRDFDAQFYNLLNNFDAIISGIDFRVWNPGEPAVLKTGRDAIKLFKEDLLSELEIAYRDDWEKTYLDWFENNQDDFGHYFRFLYHLINYIDYFSHNSAQSMLFLRAKLSESELTLLSLNCVFGEGRGLFKLLVEKYHLLHNLSGRARELLKLDDYYNERAFGGGMSGKLLGRIMENHIIRQHGVEFLCAINDETIENNYRDIIQEFVDSKVRIRTPTE